MGKGESELHRTSLVLKAPSRQPNGDGKEPSDAEKKVNELLTTLLSALKIIVTATFDDSVSEEFFSSFHDYFAIYDKLNKSGILSSDITADEGKFQENPPNCWMKILVAIFSALYAFEELGGVHCDVLTSGPVESNALTTTVGILFSISLTLELYDWKEHKVELYIPSDEKDRTLFMVDNEPMLFTASY